MAEPSTSADRTDEIILTEHEAFALARDFLTAHGLGLPQAEAMARVLAAAHRDGCTSHGLQRLPGTLDTMAHPAFNRNADPRPEPMTVAVTRVDAQYGFSILAVERSLPLLISSAKRLGVAVLAVNNGFHSTALWPVVEEIASHGLAALSMNPTHDWVAPAGGTRGALGTNPIAFAWPRRERPPYVFDFATSAGARAEIAQRRQRGEALPPDWGLDADGRPSTDPAAVLAGAMLPFGGHKGSALATMVELLAGPYIGDRTSRQSAVFDGGVKAAPCHGELILAFSPDLLSPAPGAWEKAAEDLFARITAQGARLPGDRRYAARDEARVNGIRISKELYDRIRGLMPNQG